MPQRKQRRSVEKEYHKEAGTLTTTGQTLALLPRLYSGSSAPSSSTHAGFIPSSSVVSLRAVSTRQVSPYDQFCRELAAATSSARWFLLPASPKLSSQTALLRVAIAYGDYIATDDIPGQPFLRENYSQSSSSQNPPRLACMNTHTSRSDLEQDMRDSIYVHKRDKNGRFGGSPS